MRIAMIGYAFTALVLALGGSYAYSQGVPSQVKMDVHANQEDIEIMRRLLNQLLTPKQENSAYSYMVPINPYFSTVDYIQPTTAQLGDNLGQNQSPVQFLFAKLKEKGLAPAAEADLRTLIRRLTIDLTGLPPTPQEINWLHNPNNNSLLWHGTINPYGTFSTAQLQPAVPKITFEGNYLKGHGNNFTATVSATEPVWFHPSNKSFGVATCNSCHMKMTAPEVAPKPATLTPWEKTRRELMGTSAPQTAAPVHIAQTCQPGNLTEAILDLLAENGHHFAQLPANENLSVALTIYGNRKVNSTTASAEAPAPSKNWISQVEDLKALGDLHLKQNKWDEATDAYKRAFIILYQIPASTEVGENKNFDRQKEMRSLTIKVGMALLAAGRDQQAQDWLKAAAERKTPDPLAQEAKSKPKSEPKVELPAKLIITVSKQQLLDVYAKKISLEQFKKSADIEAIGFPSSDKKK